MDTNTVIMEQINIIILLGLIYLLNQTLECKVYN